ncbi:hypothetical protein D3OALGA1CA_904 [Olavius algarvensis associated proteobacterium Delta 3]|nr:hypothetical protein D3OALGA1CA_904 [Olavius algarvensis associated proteobacterium Delta 3]CAB5129051.1 hypothetical protein D3OALGB2SA_3492 [Olavius algarvensis associated proteobacterium Delta 3]
MYKRIMVPMDGSDLAERVLPHVHSFLEGFRPDSVVFVQVVEPAPVIFDDTAAISSSTSREKMIDYAQKVEEQRKSAAAEYLDGIVHRVKGEGVDLRSEVLVGRVAERLAEYIESQAMDMIIIATHGRSGISRWVRGSIAERVLSSSRVPVLMVRPDTGIKEQ